MSRQKRKTLLACVFLAALNIAACGQAKEAGTANTEDFTVSQQESDIPVVEGTDSQDKGDESADEEASANQQEDSAQAVGDTDSQDEGDESIDAEEASAAQQENSAQAVENADSQRSAEELLDLFINGVVSAVDSADLSSEFYITDLNMDAGEWDSFSVGEKVDLDNDGENELVISGPYGGMYLDARDNRVYKFAAGEGNGCILSYTYFNGSAWIMYSNRMNAGYEAYHMEKFEGSDHLEAEINFGEEPANPDDAESETTYTWNGAVISSDEYTALCSKIFAAEVSTNE